MGLLNYWHGMNKVVRTLSISIFNLSIGKEDWKHLLMRSALVNIIDIFEYWFNSDTNVIYLMQKVFELLEILNST